jgi:hypothetical protein
MRVDRLSSFEAETLIRFLLNHMGTEVRGRLMVEFPVIYRKLMGRNAGEEFRAKVKEAVLWTPEHKALTEVQEATEGVNFSPRDWCAYANLMKEGKTAMEARRLVEEARG